MNVSIENLADQHQIIRISVSDEDYRSRFEKALKDISKKAQIPGFRQGHVPAGMVKKMYGETLILDELYKIVNEQMNAYLKENNYELLGDALPVEADLGINYAEPKTYEFVYEIGIQPEIDLASGFNKDKSFTRYVIAPNEEEVSEELDRIRKKYGQRNDVDTVETNDVIYAHATELNGDGYAKEGGIQADTYFNLQMLNDDKQELFLGAKTGEVKNIADIFSVFKGDKLKIAKNILQLSDSTEASVEQFSPSFTFRIDRIARLFPAEINDAFFTEISKEFGQINSESELREKITEAIGSYNRRITEVTLDNELFKYLNDTTSVPLPEVFLQKWFRKSNEKEFPEEDFDKEFADFLSKLKQSLIYRKMQRSHDLNVANEELIQEALQTVRMSYGQMGEDFVQYITQSQLKDKQFVENMHDRVAQKKFFDALKEYITIIEQPISLEEFQKLNKQEEVYAE